MGDTARRACGCISPTGGGRGPIKIGGLAPGGFTCAHRSCQSMLWAALGNDLPKFILVSLLGKNLS